MAFTSRLALYSALIAAAGLLGTAQDSDDTQTCWFPDKQTNSPPDVPCNSASGSGTKACCGPTAFCLDNGFCLDAGVISRGSCTDKNWGSDCPQNCITSDDCPLNGGCTVNMCDFVTSSFSCGAPTNNHCSSNTRLFTMPGNGSILLRPGQLSGFQTSGSAIAIEPNTTLSTVLQVSSSSNTTANSTSSANSTITTPSSSSVSTSSSDRFSAGAVAGAALGTGLPLLIALLAAILVIVRQKRQLNAARAMPAGHHLDTTQSQQAPPYAPNEARQPVPKPFGYGSSQPQVGYHPTELPMQQQQQHPAPTYSHFHEQLHSPHSPVTGSAPLPAEMGVSGERHELDHTVKHN